MAKQATCGPLEPFTLPLRQAWPAQRTYWWLAMNASGFVLAWGGIGTAALFVLVDALANSCDLSKISKSNACDAKALGLTFGALAGAAVVPLGVVNPAFGVAATAFAALCTACGAVGSSICDNKPVDAGVLIQSGLKFGGAAVQLGGSSSSASDLSKVAECLSAFKLSGLPPVPSELAKFIPQYFAATPSKKTPPTVLPTSPPPPKKPLTKAPTKNTGNKMPPIAPPPSSSPPSGGGSALPWLAGLGLLIKVFK